MNCVHTLGRKLGMKAVLGIMVASMAWTMTAPTAVATTNVAPALVRRVWSGGGDNVNFSTHSAGQRTMVETTTAAFTNALADELGALGAGQMYQINTATLTVGSVADDYTSTGDKQTHLITATWGASTPYPGPAYQSGIAADTGAVVGSTTVWSGLASTVQDWLDGTVVNYGLMFDDAGGAGPPAYTAVANVLWTLDAEIVAIPAGPPLELTGVGVSNTTITATDATVYADLASPDTTVSSSQVWVVWSDAGDQGETLSAWPNTNVLTTYWTTGMTATATFGDALTTDTTYTFRLFATNSGPASTSAWSAAETVYPTEPAPVTSGLACWLAADKLGLSNGDPVTSFLDRSGSGNHADNALGGGGTFTTSEINGKPVVRFTTAQTLTTSTSWTMPYTLIHVAKMTGGTSRRIVCSGNANRLYGYHDGFRDRCFMGAWHAQLSTAAGTTPHIYAFTVTNSATGTYMYGDGSLVTGNAAVRQDLGSLRLNGWNHATAHERSDCDVAEVLVYNRILTASELNEVGYYLEEKYGFATRYTPSSGALYLDDIGVSNATITTIDATVYADLGSPDASVSSSQVWVVWSDVGDQGTNALSAWPNTNELSTFWTTGTTATATFGGALSADTAYTFRLFATNSGPASTSAWSAADTFTTDLPPDSLELTAVGVSNATITATDATVYADLGSPDGTVNTSQVWVVWSDAGDRGTTLSAWPNTNELSTYWTTGTTATATFGDALSADTEYTFRLFATNSGPASASAWSAAEAFNTFGDETLPVTSGLQCRLAADRLGLGHGDPVSSFTDSSGSGNHAGNAIGGGGTFTTDEINGKPVVRFDTLRSLNTTTSFTMPYTLIHVAKMQEVTGSTKRRIVSSGTAGSNRCFGYQNLNRDRCFMQGWYLMGNNPAGTDPHIYAFTVVDNATDTAMYGDGALLTPDDASQRADLGRLQLNGQAGGLVDSSDCDVGEVLVYNRILSESELNQVGWYLDQKYGLTTTYTEPRDPGLLLLVR